MLLFGIQGGLQFFGQCAHGLFFGRRKRLPVTAAIGTLAGPQADAALFEIDGFDGHGKTLTRFGIFQAPGLQGIVPACFGQQPGHPRLDGDKQTKRGFFLHGPLDDLSRAVLFRQGLPGIAPHIPQTQGKLALLAIHGFDHDGNRLTRCHEILGLADPLDKTEFADMDQPLDSRHDFGKGPERRTARDLGRDHITGLEALDQRLPRVIAGLFEGQRNFRRLIGLAVFDPQQLDRQAISLPDHVAGVLDP